VANDCVENLDWYLSFDKSKLSGLSDQINQNLGILYQILHTCDQAKQKSVLNKYLPRYTEYTKRVQI